MAIATMKHRITLLVWLITQTWVAAQVTHNGPIIDDRGANPSTGANFNTNSTLYSARAAAAANGTAGAQPYGSGPANSSINFNPPGIGGGVVIPGLPGASITNPALIGNAIIPVTPPVVAPAGPAVAPAAPDYSTIPLVSEINQIDDVTKLKPNDKIIYQVAEDGDPAGLLLVDEHGLVKVPFYKDSVDVVSGKGMTLRDFVSFLGDKDKGVLIKSGLYKSATIRVALYHGATTRGYVTVNGSVQGGKVRIQVPTNEALTLADVLNQAVLVGNPDLKKVRITRQSGDPLHPDPISIPVDVKALNEKGQDPTMYVEPGDFVNVPSQNEIIGTVTVTGEIRAQPGVILPLPANKPLTVSEAMIQAGGWTDFSKHNVYIYRYVTDTSGKVHKDILRVDVDAVLLKGEREKDLNLEDGDMIWVEGGILATR